MNLTFEELKEKLLATEVFIDNEYLDQYCELIIQNKNTKSIKYSTQNHHIVPQCYYKAKNMPCDNSENNLITLYYKDHVLAHYYMSQCALKIIKAQLVQAYIMIFNFGGGDRSKNYLKKDLSQDYLNFLQNKYEILKSQLSELLTGVKKSEQMRKNLSKAKMGITHTEESKKLMHDIKMAIPKERFDAIYKSISEQRKGCVWMYDNVSDKYKMVHRDKVEEFLNNGWVKQAPVHSKESYQRAAEKKKLKKRNTQQKENCSIGHKGKIFINKEEECIMIYPEELEKYLNLGWVKGRLSRK